jgi:hypothetical protein
MPQQNTTPSAATIERFWQWFADNDDRLFHFERDQERTFDALAAAMNAVDPDLTFEFGPVQDGRREFVISAGGIKRGFDAVQRLAAAAPHLSRWRVIAFRLRRPVGNVVEFGGIRVDPAEVEYSLLASETAVGLHLFIPGFTEGDTRYGQAGYLLLDEALGEYDIETKLGLIKMFATEAQTGGPRYPLTELPRHFDELYRRLTAGA